MGLKCYQCSMLKLRQILPKGSKLDTILEKCEPTHPLHMHEAHDGALIIMCYTCPFRHMLQTEEEKSVRDQMEKQGIVI